MRNQNGYGPIDRFCAKHPRFGIPNLMLYLVIAQAAVYVINLILGGWLTVLLRFDWVLILRGQLWRLVSFVILPSGSSNPFFMLLSCYFYFWIGRMLEREWGTAKFSLFYLSGVLLSILSGILLGMAGMATYPGMRFESASIYYVNLSIFLVIATLYSDMKVLLFFVVPVKMKWMALIDVALILVDVVRYAMVGAWIFALMPLASFINYFIFTWPFWMAKLGRVKRRTDPQVINFKKAQRQAKKQAAATGGYHHKCAVCGITDADDPEMEFRYCSKCDGYYCYCRDHINNHIHIHDN